MKVYITTIGCKLNESELESWTRQFAAQGAQIVQDAAEADLCIVNTCTVTRAAARKSRLLAKRVAAEGNGPLVLTGCFATMAPEEARALPKVAFVVPNPEKDQLVRLAGDRFGDLGFQMASAGCRLPEAASGALQESNPISAGPGGFPHPRTRAFVKIQDGCNMSCTYCIIPMARGRARSRPQAEVVDEIARLAADGYREVVLTGVQISDYGLDERQGSSNRVAALTRLVREILESTDLPRLRLTSIAPWDLDDELLGLFSDPRVCRQLHLSLQSGSTGVLERMRRPYTAERFADAVDRSRRRVPDVGITTDVIVGFPGETEGEFRESLRFVERCGFARVHVFPYSPRGGTLAARMDPAVLEPVKQERAQRMQVVAEESAKRFARAFLGRTLSVLYEAETPHDAAGTSRRGVWAGYTDNYIRVACRSDRDLGNRIVPTRVEEVVEDGALGAVYA